MDLPILKHLDILIGLAVVMLIVSTLVVAVTQFLLNLACRRSLYVRETLTDLVAQIAPRLTAEESKYVAERLLRHPLVGRRRWLDFFRMRAALKKLREWMGIAQRRLATAWPMPKVARGEVLLRHEVVATLLEWAAAEGALARQDEQLLRERPEVRERLEKINQELRRALAQCGIADPGQAAREVRANLIEFEGANAGLPAQTWHTQALLRANLGDLTGKVFAWYDNSMERVREFFSLEAKLLSSMIALCVVFAIQLDAVDLLRRLSQDEKLRTALVAKVETAKKAYEEVTAKPVSRAEAGTDTKTGGDKAEDAKKAEEAQRTRDEALKTIRESVEALRDPKASVIPEYFLWEKVAHLRIDRAPKTDPPPDHLILRLDDRQFKVEVARNCLNRFPDCVAEAFRRGTAPVEVHVGTPTPASLTLVARSVEVSSISMATVAAGQEVKVEGSQSREIDCEGFKHRLGGVMFAWVLVSLGAPFWYDLLKKLLGLRSLLQTKDDAEREARRGEQKEAAPVNDPGTVTTQPTALQGEPTGVMLDRTASLRAQPSQRAAITRELPVDWVVNVMGYVEAEAVRVGSGANSRWYRTVQGDYLWAGDAKGEV